MFYVEPLVGTLGNVTGPVVTCMILLLVMARVSVSAKAPKSPLELTTNPR